MQGSPNWVTYYHNDKLEFTIDNAVVGSYEITFSVSDNFNLGYEYEEVHTLEIVECSTDISTTFSG